MRNILAWSLIIIVAGISGGCAEDDSGPKVGTPCIDGYTCNPGTGTGLMCFIPQDSTEGGSCIEPPADCGGTPSCECLGELEAECDLGIACADMAGQVTAACSIGDDYNQLGDSCTWITPCAPGLLCFIEVFDEPGVCEDLPACFDQQSASNSCDCLIEIAEQQCASGTGACLVLGDTATLHCS